MNTIRRKLAALNDAGIGLIEVVVAMFLLAIVALSLLPLLVTGMRLAVENTTSAAATQFANDRVKAAQAAAPDCDAVIASAATLDTTDARGVGLRATTTVEGDCSTITAGVAETRKVTTVVTRTDTGAPVATASTLVLVLEQAP